MTDNKNKYFSDEAVITWLVFSGISVFALSFLTSIVIYMFYDCWLMSSKFYVSELGCSPGLNVDYVLPVPIILGTIAGIIFTRKSIGKE